MLNAFDTSERRREIGEHKQPQRERQETVGIIQRFVGWQVCVCVTFRYGWTGQQTCEVRQAPFSARQTNSIVIFLASLSFTYRPTLHRREHTTFTHTCLLKGGEKKNTEKEKKTSFFRRASKVRFALYVNKLHQLPYVSGAFFFFFRVPLFFRLFSNLLHTCSNDKRRHRAFTTPTWCAPTQTNPFSFSYRFFTAIKVKTLSILSKNNKQTTETHLVCPNIYCFWFSQRRAILLFTSELSPNTNNAVKYAIKKKNTHTNLEFKTTKIEIISLRWDEFIEP